MKQKKDHPLFRVSVTPIQSWDEWKKRWNSPDIPAEFRLSLLQFGFDLKASQEEQQERFKLYLDIAHSSYGPGVDTFTLRGEAHESQDWERADNRSAMNASDARREISCRAFKVLCQKVFKDTGRTPRGNPSWYPFTVEQPGNLKTLLKFCESDTWNMPRKYDGNDRERNVFHTFFIELAKECFASYEDKSVEHIHPLRPRIFRILVQINRLSTILPYTHRMNRFILSGIFEQRTDEEIDRIMNGMMQTHLDMKESLVILAGLLAIVRTREQAIQGS